MDGFITMLKMNLKLLFRNKGYLCFLIILPLIAILLLNLPSEDSYGMDEESVYQVHEIQDKSQTLLNMMNTKLCIKVYDCSGSYLSDYILDQLASTGAYDIYRLKDGDMDLEEAKVQAINSANRNNIGAVVYIDENFVEAVINNDFKSSVVLLEVSTDQRIPILKETLNTYLQGLGLYSELTNGDEGDFKNMIASTEETSMEKSVVTVEVGNKLNLSNTQQGNVSKIGYSLAIVTMGFLFSGVFIASIVVDEKQNKVMTRIMLTNTGMTCYGIVKLILTFITVLIQTGVMALGIILFVKTDFGITFGTYILFIFCMGLIFNSLSVVAGILMDDILSANYVAFFVWTLSAMLAGLYFPLDAAAKWWDRVALLMPQRWVIKASEMIMIGKSGAYSMFLLVTLAFMTVILSFGILGAKIVKKD